MNENQDLVTPEDKLKLLFEHRPWESEPSYADWVDAPTKYKCRIVRNEHTGTLCGYVGIPRGHRFYGMSYQEAERDDNNFHVHGGLTYSGELGEEDGLHYFGFDTAHGGDFSPGLAVSMLKWTGEPDDVPGFYKEEEYRTWDYVNREVVNLALQLRYCDERGRSYD
jgi:hypothetical protein